MSAIDPLKPKTYLPACTECTEEDSSPDEYVCEKCERPTVVCDCCHIIIQACECGHCPKGEYFRESE